jgi:hypothetical protein
VIGEQEYDLLTADTISETESDNEIEEVCIFISFSVLLFLSSSE